TLLYLYTFSFLFPPLLFILILLHLHHLSSSHLFFIHSIILSHNKLWPLLFLLSTISVKLVVTVKFVAVRSTKPSIVQYPQDDENN
ncbi:hypothetical protein BCR42DRAFT_451976, partial [Absidia repens]